MTTLSDGGLDSSECYGRDSLCFSPQYNWLVSYPAILGGHAAYILTVLALRQFMKNRPAYSMKGPMLVYNAVQIALSITMAVNLGVYLKNGVFNLNGKFYTQIEFWILVHYVTKYLDMFDTFFMVLRKKEEQLSFLHLYHHLTIGMVWGLLLHNGIGNGTAFFGAWINSFVHSLMYSHYLFTSLGYQNPFKKYLTQVQMAQFAMCMLHAVLAILIDRQIPRNWALLQLAYHISLLYLFMRFYRQGMRKAAQARKRAAEAKSS